MAILTGSKNALKGVGFFVGGLLLTVVGFQPALLMILIALEVVAVVGVVTLMRGGLGRSDRQAKFTQMFSNNRAVNILAGARIFLFASRDVWFVVGLPVFLYTELGWSFWQVGGFLAIWVIGYGVVQALAPSFLRRGSGRHADPGGRTAVWLAFLLAVFPAGIAASLGAGIDPTIVVVVGLIAFGIAFAMNSAVHSYLILSYADNDKVAMNVGFYYMANAGGRLAGTVLSGLLYQWRGLEACLWASVALVLGAGFFSLLLPKGLHGPAASRTRSSNGPWKEAQHDAGRRGARTHPGAVADRRRGGAEEAVDARPLPAGLDRARDGRRARARLADPEPERRPRQAPRRHRLPADRARAAADDVPRPGEGALRGARPAEPRRRLEPPLLRRLALPLLGRRAGADVRPRLAAAAATSPPTAPA